MTLSDNLVLIPWFNEEHWYIGKADVKAFIKELKIIIRQDIALSQNHVIAYIDSIDKLAGEKLI